MKYNVNSSGFYGDFGGAYIPEMLFSNIDELNKNYLSIVEKDSFKKEFNYYLKKYVGRPTPLYYAKRLSENLINMGYNIVSGGTDNHLILIDLRNKNITGKEAERVLGISNITVNKNMVPFDDQSPFVTSGIRIGTPAITTRGLNEQDMDFVAETINSSIVNSNKENLLIDIGKKVESYMIDRPLFNS